MDYKKFYDAVSVLYSRAKHAAISGDDFCYEVGLLLDNSDRQNEVEKDNMDYVVENTYWTYTAKKKV